MLYIGIDLGSSFVKSALLDLENNQIFSIEKQPSPCFEERANPALRENNPQAFVEIVQSIIERYASQYTIDGVVFSTQMHGFLLTDFENRPLTSFISWQDERALERMPQREQTYLEYLNDLLGCEDIRKGGSPLKPSLAVCSLFYLLYNKLVKPPFSFTMLPDYLIAKLTGQEPCAHLTNAASSGLIDLEAGGWNSRILEKLGITGCRFPKLVLETQPAGVYHCHGQDIPLYPGIGDQQVSILGTLAKEADDLVLNIGTGSQLSVFTKQPNYGDYETRPYFGGTYLHTYTNSPGGRAFTVLIDFLRDTVYRLTGISLSKDQVWSKIQERIAEKHQVETDLEVDLSFFYTGQQTNGGAIRRIQEQNLTMEALFSAAFSSMVKNFYSLYQRLCPYQDRRHIVVAGGFARKNPLFLDMLENRFSIPCSLTPYSEDALVGLYLLAARSCGKNVSEREMVIKES